MNFENHINYNCRIILSDNTEYLIYSNWLRNQKLDYWKNWQCDAGVTRIYIDAQNNIYDGECMNQLLGNFETGWELKDPGQSRCHRERCSGCTDDLVTKKSIATPAIKENHKDEY